MGLWDPQNRDLRRKPPPETEFLVGCLSPPLGRGVLISGHNIYTYHIYTYRGVNSGRRATNHPLTRGLCQNSGVWGPAPSFSHSGTGSAAITKKRIPAPMATSSVFRGLQIFTVVWPKRPAQVTRQVYTLRYQGELLGLWEPQNRDLRRKPPPETEFLVGCLSPPLGRGVLISGHNIYTYHIYTYRGVNSGRHGPPIYGNRP